MPVGEKIHYLIDSTRHAPEFRSSEDMLSALSSFVMMSTVKETAHTGQNPKHVEAYESFTYAFAHIHETAEGMAAEQFSLASAAFQKGESVGVTVYVYDQTKDTPVAATNDIPVMALRMSEDQHGLDVLLRWPEGIKQEAVSSLSQ